MNNTLIQEWDTEEFAEVRAEEARAEERKKFESEREEWRRERAAWEKERAELLAKAENRNGR